MHRNPIDTAISEQLQGFSPEPGIGRGIKGKRLISAQIWRPRKRTEDILVKMADSMKTWAPPDHRPNPKRKRRKRRRGPRVLVYKLE